MTYKYERRLDWVKSISEEELEKRIKEAKTLTETANKKFSFYEKELERRKSLGVPLGEVIYSAAYRSEGNLFAELTMRMEFNSFNSFCKYRNFLKALNEVLAAIAKGEPIDIKVLCPLLSKGNVCCNCSGRWLYSEDKITFAKDIDCWIFSGTYTDLSIAFNIKPALDWRNSLKECGL